MITVREQSDLDIDTVNIILAEATDELRVVYHPMEQQNQSKKENTIKLVAIMENSVIGTAEYVAKENSYHISGMATASDHRRCGAARAIIEHIALLAQQEGKEKLTLSTIKETGNPRVFSQLGFIAESEALSETHEGKNGKNVTQVNMCRKLAYQ